LKWCENATGIDQFPQPGKTDIHADFGDYCYKGLRHSLSHGWSCGPAPFMSDRLLGVKILEPGGSKISVTPDTAGLEYVRGTVPTARGIITVEADKNGKFKVDVPDGIKIVNS